MPALSSELLVRLRRGHAVVALLLAALVLAIGASFGQRAEADDDLATGAFAITGLSRVNVAWSLAQATNDPTFTVTITASSNNTSSSGSQSFACIAILPPPGAYRTAGAATVSGGAAGWQLSRITAGDGAFNYWQYGGSTALRTRDGFTTTLAITGVAAADLAGWTAGEWRAKTFSAYSSTGCGAPDGTASILAPQTLTWTGDTTAVPGGEAFDVVLSGGGPEGADDITTSGAACTYSTTGRTVTVTPVSGGTCTLEATRSGGSNYAAASTATHTVTVQPAAQLSLSRAGSGAVTYGGTETVTATSDDGGTIQVTGTAGSCSVSGSGPTYTVTATSGTGTCTVTATRVAGGGFTETVRTVDIALAKASATVVADAATKVFGASDPSLTVTYSGLVAGDTTPGGTGSASCTRAPGEDVDSYTITCDRGTLSSPNYAFADGTSTAAFTITAKALSISATGGSKVYGQTLTTGAGATTGYTVTGLVGSDALTVTLTTTGGAAGATVGSYPVTVADAVFTTGSASNYTIGYTGGTLTVTKAPLTYNADAKSKAYGDADPTLTASWSGLVAGDTSPAGLSANPTCSRASGTNVGTYTITCTGSLTSTNYTITAGTTALLTITAKPVTVTASDRAKTYGDALTLGSDAFTVTGTVGTESIRSVTLTSTGAAAGAAAGTYPVVASAAVFAGGVSGSNYTITYTNGTLTVGQRALTVTPSAQSKTYGQTKELGTSAFTTSGLAGSDAISAVTLASTGAVDTAPAGTYNIGASNAVFSTGSASNYTFTYGTGTLTVSKAVLNVNADAKSKVYGDTDPTFTYALSGYVAGDSTASGLAGTSACSRATPSTQSVGTYTITCTGVGLTSDNYTFTTGTTALLTITAKPLTVTANDRAKTYGDTLTLGTAGFTTTATAYDDAVQSVTLTSTGAAAGASVGTYTVVPSAASFGGSNTLAANYTITYTNRTLTVGKANLAVDAVAASKTYGDADPSTSWTLRGFVAGDTSAAGLTGTPSCSRAPGQDAGTYAVTCAPGSLAATDYAFVTGTSADLTVTPRSITIRADDRTKTFGEEFVLGTTAFTVTGMVGGETVDAVLLASEGADPAADAGTYAIAASAPTFGSGGKPGNYAVTWEDGSLTVQKAARSGLAIGRAGRAAGVPLLVDDSEELVVSDVAGTATPVRSSLTPEVCAVEPVVVEGVETHVVRGLTAGDCTVLVVKAEDTNYLEATAQTTFAVILPPSPDDVDVPGTDGSAPAQPGAEVSFVLEGFEPGSEVDVILNSDPIDLGTFIADAMGRVTISFSIPPVSSAHTLRIFGTRLDGSPFELAVPITIAGRGGGGGGGDPVVTPIAGRLASTGAALGGIVGASLLALAAGGVLLRRSPRRAARRGRS